MHVVEEVEERVVVGAVARLAGDFVHGAGPAGGFDGGDVEWVDGRERGVFSVPGEFQG